jgi:hypothetical protein
MPASEKLAAPKNDEAMKYKIESAAAHTSPRGISFNLTLRYRTSEAIKIHPAIDAAKNLDLPRTPQQGKHHLPERARNSERQMPETEALPPVRGSIHDPSQGFRMDEIRRQPKDHVKKEHGSKPRRQNRKGAGQQAHRLRSIARID